MKVACISAFPRGNNYGMLSVDLAFEDFVRLALGKGAEIRYFNIEEDIHVDCGRSRKIVYDLLHSPDEQLSEFDAIVIWGDFTTSFEYRLGVNKHLANKLNLDKEAAADRYYKTLLFENCSESIMRKTLIVSSNILPNAAGSFDERYRLAVSRLYAAAAAIIPRDPMSVAMAQIFRRNSEGVSAGIDAAFFLDGGVKSSGEQRTRIGYSFSRTVGRKSGLIKRMMSRRFCNALSRKAQLPLYDVAWKTSHGAAMDFHKKLDEIAACGFIITDTYHCAINALRERVPVICVGQGAQHQSTTLGDKKKEYLFHSFMAQDSYVFTDNSAFMLSCERVAARTLRFVNDYQYLDRVFRNIEIGRKNQVNAFRLAIDKLLA